MANTIDWVEIRTVDPHKTAAFYEAVFGWRLLETMKLQGSAVLILDTGEDPRSENLRRIGIWQRAEPRDLGVLVYIVVVNIETTLRKVMESGGEVVVPATDFGFGYMAEFQDPGGNRFGLFEEKSIVQTPAEQIAAWSDRLRDLSALGLMYNQNLHDRESFQAIQDIAMQMLALASGETPEQIEPLRGPLFTRPTPLAVGDGAVIDDLGRILLIRRADNGLWAMPGGALQVGEAPAEGTLREVLEETGVACRPVALVGVFDSRLCGTVSRYHLYHFVFLCQPLSGIPRQIPSHAIESLEIAWFAEEQLPADLDPGHATRIPHAFRMWRGEMRVYYDSPG